MATVEENPKPSGSQHPYDRVGPADKTLNLYEGSFHDLLNDTDRDLVMQDIRDWINARLPAGVGMPARAHGSQLWAISELPH